MHNWDWLVDFRVLVLRLEVLDLVEGAVDLGANLEMLWILSFVRFSLEVLGFRVWWEKAR